MNKQRQQFENSEFNKRIRIKQERLDFLKGIKIGGKKTMAGKLDYIIEQYALQILRKQKS